MNKIAIVFAVALLFSAFGCLGKWGMNTETNYICVKSKFIDPGGEGGSHYVIVTQDGKTYEIDRSYTNIMNQQANPDVLYSSLEIGHAYNVVTTGYRIDVLYNYPLIQSIKEEMGTCCLDNCSTVKI